MAAIASSLTPLEAKVMEEVAKDLAGYDASHDMAHIRRVLANAQHIAHAEKADADVTTIVRLAALLHDVGDSKYSGSDDAAEVLIRRILTANGVEEPIAAKVLAVVDRISFHKEVAGAPAAPLEPDVQQALCIVQDADRLDAIGAVGIARCFTFGGARGRSLYNDGILDPALRDDLLSRDLSVEEYKAHSENTVGHFYAKLLKLKGMMKTEAGRQMAEGRHKAMEGFLEQFFDEVEGKR